MPDVVVVRISKEDQPIEDPCPASLPAPREAPPPPSRPLLAALRKLRQLLFLPLRTVRGFLRRLIARLRKRLFGPQAEP
jgi:hypothetical protein